MSEKVVRIVVVEDDARYRRGLETLLGRAPGFQLVGSFGSALAALEQAERLGREQDGPPWDVVLLDIELPGLSGIEAARRFKRSWPQVAVVNLTVFEEPATILAAIQAGADGYLLKDTPAGELLAQLRSVVEGGSPLTAEVARSVLDLLRSSREGAGDAPQGPGPSPTRLNLTEREHEILRGLVDGRSYKQIADHAGVSLNTVRTHIRNVYQKLKVGSAPEAVTRAIRDRLV